MLAEAFKEGRFHCPKMPPPTPPGATPREYIPIANDSGVVTKVVGVIRGEDGEWPVYHTEPCPPPLPHGYSAKALERAHWQGVRRGAFFALIGGCLGLILFMAQHA